MNIDAAKLYLLGSDISTEESLMNTTLVNAINNRQRVVLMYKDANDSAPVARTFDPWVYGTALLADGKKQEIVGGKIVGEHVARLRLDRVVEVKAILTESSEGPAPAANNSNKAWTWETEFARW
jgi:predicted DNA-binding transcriptional regulator YafY